MAIDYGTAVGQIRLSIPDLDEANFIFTEEQLEAFLSLSDGYVDGATARALRTIASNSLMLYQVAIRSDDGSVGHASATAEALLRRADALEKGTANIGFDLAGGETEVPRTWGALWL
jgi:hypothetical protein